MAKVSVSVELNKESLEVFDALAEIAKATKQALSDGFQAGQDLPAIVAAAWLKLPAAIEGISLVSAEAKEDLGAEIATVGEGGRRIYDALK